MPKFRKKPVVIEAEQFYVGAEIEGVCRCIEIDEGGPHIHTLEGNQLVSEGDWIITGVKGEKYPCKPDIFELTYEPAEAPDESKA